jgi:hypothetical protein
MAEGAALKLKASGIDPSRFRVGAYGSDSGHRPDLPAIASKRAHPHFGREPHGTEVVIIGDTPGRHDLRHGYRGTSDRSRDRLVPV